MTNLISPDFCYPFDSTVHFRSDKQESACKLIRQKIAQKEFCTTPTACICGQSIGETIATVDRYGLPITTIICSHCQTLRFSNYMNKTEQEHFYVDIYQDMYARSDLLEEHFEEQKLKAKKILDAVKPRNWNSILEIGCGAGGTLFEFAKCSKKTLGIEPSLRLADYGRSKGLDIRTGEFNLSNLSNDGYFDFIYAFHVFEHVADPSNFLTTCASIISENGNILLVVPNVFSAKFATGALNLAYFLHIAHKFNYSAKGIAILANKANLSAQFLTIPHRSINRQMPELWIWLSKNGATSLPQQPSTQKQILLWKLGYRLYCLRKSIARTSNSIKSYAYKSKRFFRHKKKR